MKNRIRKSGNTTCMMFINGDFKSWAVMKDYCINTIAAAGCVIAAAIGIIKIADRAMDNNCVTAWNEEGYDSVKDLYNMVEEAAINED